MRATLIAFAWLALAGTPAQASNHDRSRNFDPAQCRSGKVHLDEDYQAYCYGYTQGHCGIYLGGTTNFGRYEVCALGEARRKREGQAQETREQQAEEEQVRRTVEKLPVLRPEANPLLGHWRRITPAVRPRNLMESLSALGTDITCTQIAGDGPSFEFRADALVYDARTMEPMKYHRGHQGVFFALGERRLRLLAFEFEGRDRMSNGACHFERVGAAARR